MSTPTTSPFDSVRRTSQRIVKTLAANSTTPLQVSGDYFYFVECSPDGVNASEVFVRSDIQPQRVFSLGTGDVCPSGQYFTLLEIENKTAEAINIVLDVGFNRFIDNRLNIVRNRPESIQPVIEAETEIVPWAGAPAGTYEIPANGFVEFVPAVTGRRIRQTGFTVSNADPSSVLTLADGSGVKFAEVQPRQTHTHRTSQTFRVYNDTGTAIVAYVGQNYVLNPA